ncbi:hypothetical protein [Actinomadura madurae]|uniref:hypothetical protein n=3 Tax=Actinomadura madurae TaxID=1993 RepID=UPI0020D2196B|nr:hypothetical protein [Actinomadura madurae]MCQ0008447.1 hypothetical protein [Actinomadura madurae]
MTATGKPDDEHVGERPEPGQPAQTPPPPRWLDDQGAPSEPLLPEDDPEDEVEDDLVDDPEDDPEEDDLPEEPADDAPEDVEARSPEAPPEDPSDDSEDDADALPADRTVMDFKLNETLQTVILPKGRKAAAETETGSETDAENAASPAVPAPAAEAPATSTDIPAPPPFPYGEEMADVTRVEPLAPPPFPYGQDMPDVTRAEHLAPPPPAPPRTAAAAAAAAERPALAEPAAHEPFPYAQEIPGTPPPRPPAEPFPYAQQIPGAQSAPPPAEQFPWAQQMPGTPHPGQEAAHPVAPPPVIEEPWRTGGPSGGRRRSVKKPLLIGAAGLAVVALAAAGALVVPGLLGDDDGDGEAGAKLAGSLFPVDGAARTDGRDQQVTGVAALGSTVVAVGGETDPQDSRGLFLVSTDGGRTFESVAQQDTDGGVAPPGGVPAAVGASSRGWVAIGHRAGGAGAVWTSEDGKEWRRQPDAVGDVFGANDRVTRIVGTGSGFLAIGQNSPKGDFSDARPAAWLSADGRRWEERVDDQIGLQVQKGDLALVEAAAAGDVILLEGLITPDSRKPGPYRKVWRSEDGGRTWATSEVPVPKGSRGLMIGGGEGGFLAMREMKASGKLFGQAYASKDGRSWTKAGKLEPSGYGRTSGIASDGQGFTAVVVRGGDVLLSRSADGTAWKDAGTAESKAGREVLGAAAAGGQTVLVGREPGGGDTDPMLGVWDASGTAVPVDLTKIPGAIRPDHAVRAVSATGSLAVAVGSASGDAAAWSSADGASWKPAQGLGAAFTRPGPQQLNDVVAGGAGWLAVGYDQAPARRPLVVTSKDGATWQAADTAPAFGAGRGGAPVTYAAAAGSAGYVVVGTEGYSAAAWSSTDLKSWSKGAGADAKAMTGSKNATRWMLDVTAGPSGYVAVGGSRDGKGNHPSVWVSPDGKQWTLRVLELPASGVTEGHLTHVAAKGNTLVAAGIAATQRGLDWLGYVSTDAGRTWRPLESPSGETQATITALTATPKGFAATGTTGRAGATDVVSWTSADGASWQAAAPGGTGLGGVGDQQITGLSVFGDSLLGVGRSADSRGGQPVLWSRPVP